MTMVKVLGMPGAVYPAPERREGAPESRGAPLGWGIIPVARTADSKVNWCDAIRRASPFLREKGNGDDCGDHALGPDRG